MLNQPFFDQEWHAGFTLITCDGGFLAHEWRGGQPPVLIGKFPTREAALPALEAAMPAHIVWRRERVGGTGRQAMVLVPTPAGEQRLGLAPQSAVVAVPMTDDGEGVGFHVYFEGNLHGASNLTQWDQRVKCAAGRLFKRYPTVAQAHLGQLVEGEFKSVGIVTDDYRIEIFDEAAVALFLSREGEKSPQPSAARIRGA